MNSTVKTSGRFSKSAFRLLNFFSLSFLPLGFLFAAVIGLLPGLLEVKKGFRKSHRGGQVLPWSS